MISSRPTSTSLKTQKHLNAVRFIATSVLGLGVDLGVAILLNILFAVEIRVAAVAGFCIALLFNYVLHSAWTFTDSVPSLSPWKFVIYCAIVGLTLGLRLAILSALGILLPEHGLHPTVLLMIAASISFVASFFLMRSFVFRRLPA